MTKNFSFSEWLASRRAVSFALCVGIIFLFTNYSGVLNHANPDAGDYRYPAELIFVLSHIDSFFFGLVTAILLFQASKEWQKIMYCTFEAALIFLNLNRNFITEFLGFEAQFFLGSYIAVFSGVSFYFLGSLSKAHRDAALLLDHDPQDILEEERTLKEAQEVLKNDNSSTKNTVISGLKRYDQKQQNSPKVRAPKNYKKAIKFIKAGCSLEEIARGANISKVTAMKAKKYYEKVNSVNV